MNTATATVSINASPTIVWEALTTPQTVKQYFFGVDVETDWKVGSPIIYKGSWEGKPFEDKGVILEVLPQKRLVSTYWTSFSGLPDEPQNYQKVIYELEAEGEGTKLTVTQENVPTEEARKHSEQNWQTVLGALKKLLEPAS